MFEITGYHLLLLAVVLAVIPTIVVVRAATRRRRRIESGELVLVDRTNTLAVLGFVLAFFVSVPAVIVSHIALSQIRRTNERGWGLAVAGLFLGYAVVGGFAVFLALAGIVSLLRAS